jgi:hypothetical protein
VHFTREPLVETIISPKEGYKLAVRSSASPESEAFSVDAVEVVSFGKSYFFRSIERPNTFLVPVSEYEIIEVKESRPALKKATTQKSIKIAGGKETEPKEEKRRKRSRKRKTAEESSQAEPKVAQPEEAVAKPASDDSTPPPPAKLIEPPPSLISDQIKRYKEEHPTGEEKPPEPEEEEVPHLPEAGDDFPF